MNLLFLFYIGTGAFRFDIRHTREGQPGGAKETFFFAFFYVKRTKYSTMNLQTLQYARTTRPQHEVSGLVGNVQGGGPQEKYTTVKKRRCVQAGVCRFGELGDGDASRRAPAGLNSQALVSAPAVWPPLPWDSRHPAAPSHSREQRPARQVSFGASASSV